jgi:hypothetical protein
MPDRQRNNSRLTLVPITDPAVLERLRAMGNTVSDSTARRAARKAGLVAKKSRWRKNSSENQGGFMLIEPSRNIALDGWKFDLNAKEVVAFCEKYLQ